MLRSTRQGYHRRIAEALEDQFRETVETQPELLAYHYTEAGLHEQSILYWQQAGEQAEQRFAHAEAIAHLTTGLELKTLPDKSERGQQELTLQLALGMPLATTKGYAAPEVERAYTRAWELCQQLREMPQTSLALFGLWRFYLLRGALQTAQELGEQLLSLSQETADSALLLEANFALGNTLFWLGKFAQAKAHWEQSIALYIPQQHRFHAFVYGQEPGVCCRIFAACTLWYLGYPDQAIQNCHEALTLAHQQSHAFSQAFALNFAVQLHQLRQERPLVKALTESLIMVSQEQGFALWLARGIILHGWALAGVYAPLECAQPSPGPASTSLTIPECCTAHTLLAPDHSVASRIVHPYAERQVSGAAVERSGTAGACTPWLCDG